MPDDMLNELQKEQAFAGMDPTLAANYIQWSLTYMNTNFYVAIF